LVTRDELAKYLDHTLLKPEATPDQVTNLCREANLYNVAAVCVMPWQLPLVDGVLNDDITICTTIGFPSGAVFTQVKAFEAALAYAAGATEIDMVINLGMVKAAEWELVEDDISQVRLAVPKATLKVILETGVLTGDEIDACCEASELAGAQYVKTSTGFHPSGGATVEAVRRMSACVGGRLGIKASGGIRDLKTTMSMIDAGATRIGTSATASILEAVN
jgi:deoxyribose-phosphate aldolase